MTTAANTQNRAAYHITKREAMAKLSALAVELNVRGIDISIKLAAHDFNGKPTCYFSLTTADWSGGAQAEDHKVTSCIVSLPISRAKFTSEIDKFINNINANY